MICADEPAEQLDPRPLLPTGCRVVLVRDALEAFDGPLLDLLEVELIAFQRRLPDLVDVRLHGGMRPQPGDLAVARLTLPLLGGRVGVQQRRHPIAVDGVVLRERTHRRRDPWRVLGSAPATLV
jgi:hypothetical protein